MQISAQLAADSGASVTGAPRRGGLAATTLLLPQLAGFTQASNQTRAVRDDRRKEERDRRRDDDASNANGATPPAIDIARQAERRMAPGSAAAKHELQTQESNRAADFRAALRDAGGDRSAGQPTNRDGARSGSTVATPSVDSAPLADAPANAAPTAVGGSKPLDASAPASSAPTALQSDASSNNNLATTLPAGATTDAANVAASSTPAPTSNASTAVADAPKDGVTAIGAPSGATALRPGAEGATAAASPQSAASADGRAAELAHGGAQPGATQNAAGGREGTVRSRAATNDAQAQHTGNDDPNVEQIVRLVASRAGKDRSVATLRLDPPWLGSIRMHIDLRQSDMTLRVEPDTPLAHRLLSENVESLRRALEAAGIQLSRIEFRPPPDAPDFGNGTFQQALDTNGQSGSGASNDSSAQGQTGTGTDAPSAAPSADAGGAAWLPESTADVDTDVAGRVRAPSGAARLNVLV